jgi:hypothetical protein
MRSGASRNVFALFGSHLFIEVEISYRGTGNQSRSTVERQVLDRPLDENQYAALELDEVHQIDERPDEPSQKARNMEAEDIRHRSPLADDGLGLDRVLRVGCSGIHPAG